MDLQHPKIFKLKIKPEEKWFQNILNQLTPEIFDNHPNSMFFKLNDKIVMRYCNSAGRQELKNGTLYVSYSKIWSFFEFNFGLRSEQIKGLIKDMMEEHYKFRDLTPELTHTTGHPMDGGTLQI